MADLRPPYSAESVILPLLEGEDGCRFLVRDHVADLLAETMWGPERYPNIATPKRRRSTAFGHVDGEMAKLLKKGLIAESNAWLSGAHHGPRRLFPADRAGPDGASPPPDLYGSLVKSWREHPGHAVVPIFVNLHHLDFVVNRHRDRCPRSEPLAAEQTLAGVRIARWKSLREWSGDSAVIEVPGEVVDRTRHVAIARYTLADGRKGLDCVPMCSYWHCPGSDASEADREAVMGFLDRLRERCRREGRAFEVYAPGFIAKIRDKTPRTP